MDIKKAIKFMRSQMYINLSYTHKEKDDGDMVKIKNFTNKYDEVITLLQQGEKYREMWEKFRYGLAHVNIGSYRDMSDERRNKMTDLDCVNEICKRLEQRYFPKLCSDIELLEQLKNEFVKQEHSYYIERFMETCIKLFKEKEG